MKYRNVFPDPSIISSRSRQGFPWDLSRRREDLSLDLEEGRLTLEGHRSASTREEEGSEGEEASRTYYRRERARGAFRRTFTLPDDLKREERQRSPQRWCADDRNDPQVTGNSNYRSRRSVRHSIDGIRHS